MKLYVIGYKITVKERKNTLYACKIKINFAMSEKCITFAKIFDYERIRETL